MPEVDIMKTQTIEQATSLNSTTKQQYITSIAALNIPCPEGTGDWHFSDCFIQHDSFVPKQQIAGIDTLSTYDLLGDFGIFECSQILKKYGASPLPEGKKIYAANHYRAVVDMIFDLVKNGENITGAVILDDWFPEEQEKKTVYQLIDKLMPALSLEQWKVITEWKQQQAQYES